MIPRLSGQSLRALAAPTFLAALALLAAGCGLLPGLAGGLDENQPASETAQPTSTLSATPSPPATATPSPTATLHPLTIESMRQGEYPGSDIVLVENLPAGSNYARYIISYQSEGLAIRALLTVPFGAKPPTGWPVIIFNHGFIAPNVYRTTERYIAYVDNLARSGYIVLRSDYRGHDQSEGIARGAYGYPDYVIDVLNAVGAMRRYPEADPSRIGIWGHSMGGYISLRAMVIDPEIRAGVIWAGVVASYPDLVSRWRPTSTPAPGASPTPSLGRGWRSGLAAIYGSPQENPAFWNSISANAYLEDLGGPLQLHHGTADTSVPVLFSELLYEQVSQAGGVAELYVYPGADHNLSAPFQLAMQRTLEFYEQYLKGP